MILRATLILVSSCLLQPMAWARNESVPNGASGEAAGLERPGPVLWRKYRAGEEVAARGFSGEGRAWW